MTESSNSNQQNGTTSNPGGIRVTWGDRELHIQGAKALMIVVFGAVIVLLIYLVLSSEALREVIDRQIDKDTWKQWDAYVEQQKHAQEVISKWNQIKSINDRTNDVKAIRVKIKGAIQGFESLKIDKLNVLNAIQWNMDAARLNNIQLDITGNRKYFKKAIDYAMEADKLASGKGEKPLTATELAYLAKHDIGHNIDWIFLASYSLYTSFGSSEYKGELDLLKRSFGGCDGLSDDALEHDKMLKGLECKMGS